MRKKGKKKTFPSMCHTEILTLCPWPPSLPRHDMPTDPNDPLADQNIKDRYYGTTDPVAARLLSQAKSMPSLEPPSDKSITTLYVGGLEGKVEEGDLRQGLLAAVAVLLLDKLKSLAWVILIFLEFGSKHLQTELISPTCHCPCWEKLMIQTVSRKVLYESTSVILEKLEAHLSNKAISKIQN